MSNCKLDKAYIYILRFAYMPEAQEPPKPPEAVAPKAEISPDILSSLGLTSQDVKEFDKSEIERKKLMEEQRGQGAIIYGDLRRGMMLDRVSLTIRDLGGMGIKATRIEEIPDAIMNEWEKLKKEHPGLDKKEGKTIPQIKAWLEGFGNKALEVGDWKTAVISMDVATDGNVSENEELMAKLREVAAADKSEGVEIAKTMQGRINKRSQATHPTAQPTSTT